MLTLVESSCRFSTLHYFIFTLFSFYFICMKIFLLQFLFLCVAALGSAFGQQQVEVSHFKNGNNSTEIVLPKSVEGLPSFLEAPEMKQDIAREYAQKYLITLYQDKLVPAGTTQTFQINDQEVNILADYIDTYYQMHYNNAGKEIFEIVRKAKADLNPLIGLNGVWALQRLGVFNYQK